MISYKTWIKNYENLNAPLGDLARDIVMDDNFPKSTSGKRILEYLTKSRAIDAAIEEFKKSWFQYKTDTELGYQMLEYGVVDNKLHVYFSPTKASDRLPIYIRVDKLKMVICYSEKNYYKTGTNYEHFIDLDPDHYITNEDIRFITKKEYDIFSNQS
jgi:hypothetical protein